MKKEQLQQLINQHKRLNNVKKPQKRHFKVILWKYTGRSIIKTIERYMTDLKNDLEIVFKPVKPFRRKDLEGVDTTTLYQDSGTHTQNSVIQLDPTLKESAGTKEKPAFVNWFDVGSQEKPNSENTKCTYTDKYGNTTSLDEAYEELKRQSD